LSASEAIVPGTLPPGFVWGAATSAYQIEGAPREDGKGESIWDRFTHLPGRTVDGTTGDVACDHYHRSREDVAILAALGLGAYRFSIAWTRVLPLGTGAVNGAGLDFYDRLVDDLLAAGIEPWITLYHWDLPQALEDLGGWPRRETAAAFSAYADVVTRRLGDRVRRWITVNEPWEIGFLGYQQGLHAPGRTSLADALAAIHTVLLAHGDAVSVIRTNAPEAQVGLAIDLVACYPDRDDTADLAAAHRLDGHFNRWFLDPLVGRGYPSDIVEGYGTAAPDVRPGDVDLIATPIDFVGLNYYYSHWVRASSGPSEIERLMSAKVAAPKTSDVTGLGWAVHPDGLRDSLVRLASLDPAWELVVTESGAAYRDLPGDDGSVEDVDRLHYHAAYLEAVRRAIRDGAPVRGYFAWSLLDNFEWSQGYGPRFGIVRVDYQTQRRTIKASGQWIAANARGQTRARAHIRRKGVMTE
jgi:beta-glucosidase